MKIVNVMVIVILFSSTLALGCTSPAPTPTPTPLPTVTLIPTPVVTADPGQPSLPISNINNVQQTTNGRTYPSPSAPAIVNGSKKGGLTTGELGRQR